MGDAFSVPFILSWFGSFNILLLESEPIERVKIVAGQKKIY